jgi:hypothetical protein
VPNIVEINAPQNIGLQPSEIGPEAAAAAGRRLGAFYNQVGEAKQRFGERAGQEIGSSIRDAGDTALLYETHREVSHGSATFASLADDLTNKWNDTAKNADPNDPSAAAKFREEVLEPALDKFRQGFNTEASQNWAEHHIEQLRDHMFEKTAADMSTLAGQAAKVNTAQTINTLSNTVYKDPSGLKFALDSLDSSVGGIVSSSPNLRGAAAATVRSEISERGRESIVKSAAIGAIQKTGQVPDWVNDPQYSKYVSGPELKQFQKAAEVQQRTNMLIAKQDRLTQQQLDDQAVHAATNKAFNDNVTIDPSTGRPIIKPQFFQDSLAIAHKYPNAPNAGATVRTLLDWGEHQQNLKSNPVDDPDTRQFNIDHMFDADKPTTEIKILRDEAEGKLTRTTAAVQIQLVKALSEQPLKGPIWQDTMKAAQAELVLSGVGLPGKDIAGEANYAKFVQSFIPQYLSAVRSGNVPPNALDLKDPNSMVSQAMAPFKRTMTQRMNDYTKVLGVDNTAGQTVTGVSVKDQPVIRTQADYDKLAPGSSYLAPDGKVHTKGAK